MRRADQLGWRLGPRALTRLIALMFAVCTLANTRAAEIAEPHDLYWEALQSISEGRKGDASDALTRMVETVPQHAGAWLDLALIQCELGHALEAERLFQAIEARFAPPPGILEVIAKQRVIGCAGWARQRRWSLTLGRGREQNVNQGASNPNFSFGQGSSQIELQLSPEFLPQADNYTTLGAEYSLELSTNGINGFVQFQTRHNDRLSKFNNTALFAGVERPWRIRSWGVRTSAVVGLLSLDGHLYQRQSQLQARITPPISLPKAWQLNFTTSLTHIQYLSITDFNANTIDLRSQLSYRGDNTQATFNIGYANDHALAARPGGDRQGWLTSIQGRTRIKDDIFGELAWSRQTWLSQSGYLPPNIPQTRDQETQIFRATLLIPVGNRHSAQIELRRVKNKENISIFQYNNSQIQVNWLWQSQ